MKCKQYSFSFQQEYPSDCQARFSFMYGGNANPNITGNMTTAQISQFNAFDEVYVLSLPAFAWFKANYTAVQSRQKHTCEVFRRQMLSIGGYSTTDNNLGHLSTDRFSQGLGIFDLTAMQWSDSYDTDAAPYQTPDVVKAWYRENGSSPAKWDDPALEDFFQKEASATNPGSSDGTTSSETPSPTSSKPAAASSNSHNSHAGAIAGGVVGGVAAVCLLAALIFGLLRLKRRRDGDRSGYARPRAQSRTELPVANSEKNRMPQELSENYRPLEMDGSHPTMELEGRGQSYLRTMKIPPPG